MKRIRPLLFWTIGIFFIIVSMGSFGRGDYGAAIIWLIVGIIFLPPIREKLFNRKQNEILPTLSPLIRTQKLTENQKNILFEEASKISSTSIGSNEMTITLDLIDNKKLIKFVQENEKEKQRRIKDFRYLPQQVSSSVLQTLESIEIMDTTKNFDTLKGRHQFVEEKLSFLRLASYNKRYLMDIQIGLDQYKTLYYDKVPKHLQIAALLKPNEFKYAEFYCQCIINSFQRFYDEQNKEIAILKKPEAIKNRREKIMDTVREIQKDIPSSADSFSEVNDRLEKIYQRIYQETYG